MTKHCCHISSHYCHCCHVSSYHCCCCCMVNVGKAKVVDEIERDRHGTSLFVSGH